MRNGFVRSALLRAILVLGLFAISSAPAWALQVTGIFPQGEVPRLTQVVVRFDRPMRPLGQLEQAPDQAPLGIEPRPAGGFRWLDPQTLAFLWDQPQQTAASFQLKVPAGTKALDGSTLDQAVEAQVWTPPVAVTEIQPPADSLLERDTRLYLYLNQPVDPEALRKALTITVNGQPAPVQVRPGELSPWEAQNRGLGRMYIVEAAGQLPAMAKIELVLAPGLAPQGGGPANGQPFAAQYGSYQPLVMNAWRMGETPGGGYNPESQLVLEFNNPVSPAAVWAAMSVTPALPAPPEAEDKDAYTRWVVFSLDFQPQTTYHFNLPCCLPDEFGTKLTVPSDWQVATGNRPPLFMAAGRKGVIEAQGKPIYAVKVRNVPGFQAGLQWIPPDQAAKVLTAEDERPWDQEPQAVDPAQPGATRGTITPKGPANQSQTLGLNLDSLLGRPAKGGLVLVDLRTTWPDDENKPHLEVRRALVQVTDLGLSLKLSRHLGLAWVTGLADAKPRAGVNLELRDRQNRVVWQGVSDAEGLAVIPGLDQLKLTPDKERPWRNPVAFLLARQGEDFAVLPSDWGDELMWSLPADVPYLRPGQEPGLTAHVLTQLPLYQPGQSVNYLLYLRDRAIQGLRPPAPTALTLEVEDPRGRKLHVQKATSDAFGAMSGSLELAANAPLGQYYVYLRTPQASDRVLVGNFRVASFRPPDFRVDLAVPASVVGAQEAPARVQAAYLFGAPLPGAQAKLRVRQAETDFAPPGLEGYATGGIPLPGEVPDLNTDLGEQTAQLDAQGRAEIKIPAAKPLPGYPARLEISAAVTDPSQRQVSDRGVYVAHPAEVYLGLKAPLLMRAGQAGTVEGRAVDPAGKPLAPARIQVTAYREYWETVREKGPGGFFRYYGQVKRDQVWESTLSPTSDRFDFAFTPPQAGSYVLEARTTDAQGRANLTDTYVWATGAGEAGWQRYDDYRLELKAETADLAPGQSARVMIQNPFSQATALISIENGGVRRTLVRQVEGPAPVIEVPVQASDAPGVYVGVLLVRGRNAQPSEEGPDLGRPQVRLGFVPLTVRDPNSRLAVSVAPSATDLKPGQEVSATISVTRGGAPAPCQLNVLAVDERVLVAAGGQDNYDPRRTFDQRDPLAVLTADLRSDVLGQVLAKMKADYAAGGGGVGESLRSRFHPAVFWLAQAPAPEGSLTVKFKLPDSLTAYRVLAVAADQAAGFGVGQTTVRAKLPLQLLSALPRFALSGDEFSARVLVQNLSGAPGQAVVGVQAQGIGLTGPAQQTVDLAPGETRAVGFAVKADQVGTAALSFSATLAGESDAARFSLPVLATASPTTQATAGVLDPEAGPAQTQVDLALPADALADQGGLSVTVAPGLAALAARPAQYLRSYPWDCLEQLLGKAAVRAAALNPGGRALGLMPQPGDQGALSAAIARVPAYQTESGGFSFWPGMDEPDFFLTAYALLALDQLRPAAAKPDAQVIKNALSYLQQTLKEDKKPLTLPAHLRLSRALAIWVLARHGRDVRGWLSTELKKPDGLPPFALAALMQTAGGYGLKDAVAGLAGRLEKTAEASAGELHFETVLPGGIRLVLGSTLRGNAAALWALAAQKPDFPRLDALATWVARRLGEAPGLNTQEAAFGLWALGAYLGNSGAAPDLGARLALGDRELLDHRFTAPDQPPVTAQVERNLLGAQEKLDIVSQGRGRLFWSARLSFAPGQPPAQPVNAGFTVGRFLQAGGGQGPWALGTEAEMVLTLVVPHDRHQVLVQAPYPAGFEPLEPYRSDDQADDPGPWQWSERRLNELLLYAPHLEPGVYTYRLPLRAVAPGTFTWLPAQAQEMYAPEVFGHSGAGRVEVR